MRPPSKTKLPSPQERLGLILAGLGRREPIRNLCRQAGVSRELFYRWLRQVRSAGLKALEARAPGPKRIPEEKAPAQMLKLEARAKRLEEENRALRKDRDHWKMVAELARRIIRREGWGPAPRAPSKKKAMPSHRRENATSGSGPWNAPQAPQPEPSPGAGGSAGAATGGGAPAKSQEPGTES